MTTLAHIADALDSSGSTFTITGASQATWGTGTRGIIYIVTAYSSTGSVTHPITGGGVTWSLVVTNSYSSRRNISLFESDGTPDGGDLTVTCAGTGTYQETAYSVDEVAEWSGSGAVVAASQNVDASSTTAQALGNFAALTGGEIVTAAIGVEQAATTNLVGDDDGVTHTSLHSVLSGSNIRHFLAINASTDIGPGFTWTTTSNGGLVGCRLTDGATGSHAVGGGGLSIPVAMHHYINNTGSGL